jgi:hypothetical protein
MMAKRERRKREKGSGNGRWLRAIIGIVLALIMLGSVIAALMQM